MEATHQRTITVSAKNLPFLQGHFPGNPIVPGAVLLGWMLEASKGLLAQGESVRVRRVKFLQPLRPGDDVKIIAETNGELVNVTARAVDEMGGVYARASIRQS